MNSDNQISGAKIILAYVSYPVTTAAYLERALRRKHNVVTAGPKIGPEIIRDWQLENMKLPVLDHQIPLGLEPDMGALFDQFAPDGYPDLYLWSESVNGYFPKGLDKVRCPKACYFVDSHLNLDWHVEWAKHFNFVFIAQREYVDEFRAAGNRNVYWLPLGCDTAIHRKMTGEKQFDVGFVGSLNNERRIALIDRIRQVAPVEYRRCFWEEMSDFFSRSRIVFNNAVRNDLNMRIFEAMSTGSFVLTDLARNSGQDVLFHDREDLGIYEDATINETIRWYLEHEPEREAIAVRGQQLVHAAHTYEHRMAELINVVLGGASNTPTAEAWRERSVRGLQVPTPARQTVAIPGKKTVRSFVIPVLDMSPASRYNFGTLLNDLSSIEGDVIAVFNSREMADAFAHHPRVTYSAVMSHNVGVARAWNIGLHMSSTPVTFILNADLHITREAVEAVEAGLLSLPNAAVAGPQGSYVHFSETKDHRYFDKGSCTIPTEVDAVSGFFFAVLTRHFSAGPLAFDDAFTPCYFEEWDMGLQCKRAGLKSYVVPTTAYDHEWSGSIRALRSIRYFNDESTAGEILERNRSIFLAKWKEIMEVDGRPDYFTSVMPGTNPTIVPTFDEVLQTNDIHASKVWMESIAATSPGESSPLAYLAVIACVQGDEKAARMYIDRLRTNHPAYDIGQLTPMVERAVNHFGANVIARFDLLNMMIQSYGYRRYLEIGVAGGETFSYVKAELKHGVDPAATVPVTFPVTSDEFFRSIAPGLDMKYDLIFIDGLHHSDQVDKDIENALEYLSEDGTIMLHDCNPPAEIVQEVPRKSVAWTGDVWKSILRLRMTRPDLTIMTVDTDWGCGVVRRGGQTLFVTNDPNPFTWRFLTEHRNDILNLVSVAQFRDTLTVPVAL